jgi:hypothetical protein
MQRKNTCTKFQRPLANSRICGSIPVAYYVNKTPVPNFRRCGEYAPPPKFRRRVMVQRLHIMQNKWRMKRQRTCLLHPNEILDVRAVSGRGHTKESGNRNFRELLSDWTEHVELNEQRKLRKRHRNCRKIEKLNSQAAEQASFLTVMLQHSFLV